jgi:hypothetical protein
MSQKAAMESREQACVNSMSILLLILQLCNANEKNKIKIRVMT